MYKTTDEKAVKFLNRATLLGLEIEELEAAERTSVYLIKQDNENYTLYIPKEVKILMLLSERLTKLRGNLKVIGGEGMIEMLATFTKVRLDLLDLSRLNTDKCEVMNSIFCYSKIRKIIFGDNWNTSKVKSMYAVFSSLNMNMFNLIESDIVLELDLNNWDMSKVEDISRMFYCSSFKTLKINKWNLQEGTKLYDIFEHVVVDKLDLTNINLRKMKLCKEKDKLTSYLSKYTKIKEIYINKEDFNSEYVMEFILNLKSGANIIVK